MRSSTANSVISAAPSTAFDSDFNQSGQQGAQRISACLASRGLIVRRIQLPNGHDPNSFFVQGAGDTQQFQRLLEEAHT